MTRHKLVIKKQGQFKIYIQRINYSSVINDSHSKIPTYNMGGKSKEIIYVDSSLRTVPYGTLLLLSMALDVKCTMVKFKRVVV